MLVHAFEEQRNRKRRSGSLPWTLSTHPSPSPLGEVTVQLPGTVATATVNPHHRPFVLSGGLPALSGPLPPAWLTPQLLPRSKDHLASAPLMMPLCSLVDPALPHTAQLCLRAEWASQEAKATVYWLPLGLSSVSLPTCSHSQPRRRKTARPDLLACSSFSGGGWTLRGDGR